MKKYSIFKVIVAALLFTGCVTTIPIAYHLTSVPEEGGISFTQLTQEDEHVAHPVIIITESGDIRWYAAPLLALSPNGEKLAYLASNNNYYNLYIRNMKGGRSKVQRTFNRNVSDMAYSPDGLHIAFTDKYAGNSNINLINASEGAAVTQLAGSTENEVGPVFTPGGEKVF